MTLAQLGWRGPRLTLVNLVTGARLVVNAHPGQIGWSMAASWAHHEVPGRWGTPVQYTNTGNAAMPPLELVFDRRLPEPQGGTRDLVAVQAFLRALVVPTTPAPGVTGPPPSTLLVWPGLLSFEALVTNLAIEHREIGANGATLLLAATLTLEAAPFRTTPPGGS